MFSHKQTIIEQFTRQAIPFTQINGHYDAIDLLIQMAAPAATDEMLDVACGPGIVACSFARHCAHVTGLDVTPAMIAQAQKNQTDQEIANITWQIGTCLPLPFANDAFSLVLTRYSFHHFLNPAEVLAEMIRAGQAEKSSSRILPFRRRNPRPSTPWRSSVTPPMSMH